MQHHKKRAIPGIWEDAFFAALALTGNVSAACDAADITRATAYKRRKGSAGFRERWEEAREEAADLLEAEAVRRAVEGVERPVFYQGKQCGVIPEYSDTLLIFLLKAARPEKYRDNYRPGRTQDPSVAKVIILPPNERFDVG